MLTTFLCLRALVGDDSGTVPVPGVVHKGHMRVIEGMIELINKGKYELQSDLLEFIPEITTRSSEHHAHAVMVVVQVCALTSLNAASFSGVLFNSRLHFDKILPSAWRRPVILFVTRHVWFSRSSLDPKMTEPSANWSRC